MKCAEQKIWITKNKLKVENFLFPMVVSGHLGLDVAFIPEFKKERGKKKKILTTADLEYHVSLI